jgi:hypothetical protein
MAVFSIEIADVDINRVIDAVSSNYNWLEQVDNPNFDLSQPVDPTTNPETIANPEDKFKFTNRMVRQFLSDHVMGHEVNQAKANAVSGLNTSVSINDPLI